jgi:hypothetical protein
MRKTDGFGQRNAWGAPATMVSIMIGYEHCQTPRAFIDPISPPAYYVDDSMIG